VLHSGLPHPYPILFRTELFDRFKWTYLEANSWQKSLWWNLPISCLSFGPGKLVGTDDLDCGPRFSTSTLPSFIWFDELCNRSRVQNRARSTALRDRDLIASKLITAAERKRWNLRSWCQGGLLGLCCSGDTRPSCSTWGWGSMSTGGFGHRSLLGGLFCVWRQTIVRAKLGFTLEEMTWRARNAGTSHDRNVLIAPTTKRIW